MKIDELLDLIQSDIAMDRENLDNEALKIPLLHHKYYRLFMEEVRTLKAFDLKYAQLKKERMEFYLGTAADEVYKAEPLNKKYLKSEVDVALNADEKLSEVQVKRDLQKQKVQLLEDFIKTINNRSFLIRDAIDFRKFKEGLN